MGKRTIWREEGERECGRRGDGTACCTSKWLCFPECAAQSLVTRLSKLEGSLSLSEAQPERASVFLFLNSKLDRNYIKKYSCGYIHISANAEKTNCGRKGVLGFKE